jgi:hypothetical protein
VVLEDLVTFMEGAKKIGLELNPSKCELIIISDNPGPIHDRFMDICKDIQLIDADKATLLGSALGGTAVHDELHNKGHTITRLCETLKLVPSHAAFFLLKNCFAAPKLMYLFRTAPTFTTSETILEIESQLRNAAERILNSIMDDKKWIQLSLPVKMGGFGLQKPLDLAAPAYISSVLATYPLVMDLLEGTDLQIPLTNALEFWSNRSGGSPTPTQNTTRQKSWMRPINEHMSATLQHNMTSKELARFRGTTCPGSGDWLSALPSSNLGLELSDDAFQISSNMRLGAPVITECTCICGATNDSDGNHALVCTSVGSRSRISRHDSCNKIIQEALKSAGIPSTLEPRGLLRDDGKRPDGVSLMAWARGRVIAWDFTCTHRLSSSNAHIASEGPTAAIEAEHRKRGHYSALPNYVIFEPIAIETLGGIGSSSYSFLKTLGHRISAATNDARSFNFLRQRLSIAVNRGNASCILESLGAST